VFPNTKPFYKDILIISSYSTYGVQIMSRVVKVAVLFLTLFLLTLGVISNSFLAQEVVGTINPPPSFFDDNAYNGSHYYLHCFNEDTPPYLRPESPDLDKTTQRNRARVTSGVKTFFPFAREDMSPLEDKYDPDPELAPRISLMVNTGSAPGKALDFELWFDFDGLAEQESDVEVKAMFDTHFFLTTGETEKIEISASEITGTWQNFSEEPNKGNIKLVVWREDNQTEDVFIYCGAYKSLSWIVVPFKFHRDFQDISPNDDDNGSPVKTIVFIGIVVGVPVIAVAAYYFYWRKNNYKPEEEEDDDNKSNSKLSTSEKRQKKKDKQQRKSKKFYRDK